MKPELRISILLSLLLACSPESDQVTSQAASGVSAMSFANSEWSAPVNLGPTINSSLTDFQSAISKDGRSLYFTSNRAGGVGGNDIWVSRRDCADCAWETPENVAVINTPFLDGGPALSHDGHLMFFHSSRPGGPGGNDLYVSRRANPKDDFGWEPPRLLGIDVNTAAVENSPYYQQSAEDGAGNLYFGRGPSAGDQNIYYASVTRDGETRGPAVLVVELSDLTAGVTDAHPSLRTDGREVFFQSNRAGALGGLDLWSSTRRSVHERWSSPLNLGAQLNTGVNDQQPNLSSDGRTLIFASDRSGSLGGNDLWMATRTPSGN